MLLFLTIFMGLCKKTIDYISLILRLLFVLFVLARLIFLKELEQLHLQAAIGRGEVEMIECFEANKSIKNDRNRIRKRQRFCVVQCEYLKVLFYREYSMRPVGVLHHVQYSKNISHHRGINATPYSVHLGEHRPISV